MDAPPDSVPFSESEAPRVRETVIAVASLPLVVQGRSTRTPANGGDRLENEVAALVRRWSERPELQRMRIQIWSRGGLTPAPIAGTAATAGEVYAAVRDVELDDGLSGLVDRPLALFVTDAPLEGGRLAFAFSHGIVVSTRAMAGLRRRLGGDPWSPLLALVLARHALRGEFADPFKPAAIQVPGYVPTSSPHREAPSDAARSEADEEAFEVENTSARNPMPPRRRGAAKKEGPR